MSCVYSTFWGAINCILIKLGIFVLFIVGLILGLFILLYLDKDKK